MADLQSFEQFISTGTVEVSAISIVTSIVLAAVLSYIISKLYVKYGESVSNRKAFANNFVLLTVTTTLIIFIVKSSLALSLGLVGALSIVRFRSAIKEPEELVFLFLCIAIGLGLGAGQIKLTLVSFAIIVLLILLRHKSYKKNGHHDMHFIVSGKNITLEKVTKIVRDNSIASKLRRFDQSHDGNIEASYSLELKSFQQLEKIRTEISKLSKDVNITYLDKIEL